MAECPHTTFESLITVTLIEPAGLSAYHQARIQLRCVACEGPLTFSGLPPVNPTLFLTVAVGAGGAEIYLSGTVTPVTPPQQGQEWTPVAPPPPP